MKEELFCYLRVSSQSQLDEGNSIENQRFLGQRVSKQLGMKYVEMNEEVSSTMIRDTEQYINSPRPVLEELKEGMRIGRVKNVWYYSRSRWCRDEIEDGLIRRHFFQKYQIKVFEGVNGELRKFGTSQERYMDSQFSLIQEFFKDQNREVSVSGKRHKSRSEGHLGVFMGGSINFGYKNVDKKWVLNKDESKWVKKMFQMYVDNKSLQEIKQLLDSEGIQPRRSKVWNIGTLLTMLKNKVYIGEYHWKDKETGEKFVIQVPKVVSHSLFNRVQKKIEKNQKNKGENFRKHDTLLSDFLNCYCGETITGHIKLTHNTGPKKYYYCHSKENKWKGKNVDICLNRRSMNMDRTDELVTEKIKEVVGNSSILKEKFKTDILSNKSLQDKEIEEKKKKLEKQIDLLDKEIESLHISMSTNEVNLLTKSIKKEVHKRVKQTLEEELSNVENNKKFKIKEIDELDRQKDWVDWLSKYSKDISKQFNKVSTELLEGVVSKIVVHPTYGKNREGVDKQIGHKFDVYFKLPIVNDSILYKDDNDKRKGYELVNGVKSIKENELPLNLGGRPKKKPK